MVKIPLNINTAHQIPLNINTAHQIPLNINTAHQYFSLQFTLAMNLYFPRNTFNRNVFWKMKYEQMKRIYF
jgi:hypothetical protein